MVYESSTRRIYTSAAPRPVISTSYSYSPVGPVPVVTKLHRQPHLVLAYAPGINKGHVINPIAIPRVAHKRLVAVSPPPRRAHNGQNYYDMLESGITGNFGNRIILVRYRPSPPPVPQSKVMYIEDVTDPSGSRLLRRELSPTPSLYYGSPWEITGPSSMIPIPRPMFSLHNIPLRSASEVKEVADLRRLYVRDRNPDVGYSALNKALLYRMPSPCYVDPTIPQNYYIGRGNLACLTYAGGRPISKRRRFYPDYDDKIRDEVIFRSFYSRLRDAASVGRNAGKRPIYQPIYYSKKTILGEANVPKREPKESKWVERALANEKPPTPRANKPASIKQPVATETVIAPPRKESLKLESKPMTPPPVQPVNVTLPGPRKSITEIIKEDLPRIENLPEESVTVKMPKKQSIPKEPTPPPQREPTPPPPKEPTPVPEEPPKEPAPVAEEVLAPPEPSIGETVAEPPPTEEPPTAAVDEPVKESAPSEPTPVEEPPAAEAPAEEAAPSATPAVEETTTPAVDAPVVEEQPTEAAVPVPAPTAEEAPAKPETPAEEAAPSSEPASEEVSAPAAPSDQASGEADDASNKETSQSAATADQMPQVESPQETEGSANASQEPAATEPAAPTEDTAKAPENDQDAVSPTPVRHSLSEEEKNLPNC